MDANGREWGKATANGYEENPPRTGRWGERTREPSLDNSMRMACESGRLTGEVPERSCEERKHKRATSPRFSLGLGASAGSLNPQPSTNCCAFKRTLVRFRPEIYFDKERKAC